MPLQDIFNCFIDFCGNNTVILPPDPIPSKTNTENDNPPKNYQKKRKKSLKFGILSKITWKKQGVKFRRSTESKNPSFTYCV